MTRKQERLVFRALAFLFLANSNKLQFDVSHNLLLKELNEEAQKCGDPKCGNGGEHKHE